MTSHFFPRQSWFFTLCIFSDVIRDAIICPEFGQVVLVYSERILKMLLTKKDMRKRYAGPFFPLK